MNLLFGGYFDIFTDIGYYQFKIIEWYFIVDNISI